MRRQSTEVEEAIKSPPAAPRAPTRRDQAGPPGRRRDRGTSWWSRSGTWACAPSGASALPAGTQNATLINGKKLVSIDEEQPDRAGDHRARRRAQRRPRRSVQVYEVTPFGTTG